MTNTNTDKIVIKGIPAKFDPNELERRQQQHKFAYQQTQQCCEMVRGAIPQLFLQAVSDKIAAGYSFSKYPINMESLNYFAHLVKPPAMQEVDIATINNDVRDAYKAELEADHAKYQNLLLEQLLQVEEQKQVKAAASAKEKLMARLQKEVADCYAPLVFPDA
ncbi:hypothetical protein [Pseudomonas sp. NKUCC02_KPG]|uniref:hypothetical protein n=1 Tax=Pseudomonas sp. NKUCC02_KPG TaxID=2842124 RepID=UPI001C5B53CA|nr:hypothetical protein [Pseudomonas sp. NKUCC02_KPG]MBW3503828.1 hypothetical protein [Pseudomonas sp. NKUCC02_KPG]